MRKIIQPYIYPASGITNLKQFVQKLHESLLTVNTIKLKFTVILYNSKSGFLQKDASLVLAYPPETLLGRFTEKNLKHQVSNNSSKYLFLQKDGYPLVPM